MKLLPYEIRQMIHDYHQPIVKTPLPPDRWSGNFLIGASGNIVIFTKYYIRFVKYIKDSDNDKWYAISFYYQFKDELMILFKRGTQIHKDGNIFDYEYRYKNDKAIRLKDPRQWIVDSIKSTRYVFVPIGDWNIWPDILPDHLDYLPEETDKDQLVDICIQFLRYPNFKIDQSI